MDQWKPPEGFFQAHQSSADLPNLSQSSCPNSSQRVECQPWSSIVARKMQKADREKMRRDRLNEQFLELGNALDPERPKNDKATILADTIQMLKDFSGQVDRLKAEYATLSEESRELAQEKNELREEKASLKSEIDNLNAQYQQSLRVLYPWAAVEPSVVLGPPPAYPFPVPVPIPSGPVPIHPSLHPYPFFRNQRSGTVPNQCSTYMPYSQPCNLDQPSTLQNPLPRPCSNKLQPASTQDLRSKTSHQLPTLGERSEDYCDVATELELKTPGSAVSSYSKLVHDKDFSSDMKEKQWSTHREGSSSTDPSSSCGCSTGGQESSATSVGNGSVAENLN